MGHPGKAERRKLPSAEYSRFVRQSIAKLRHCFLQDRVADLGSDLGQRCEHEQAFRNAGVRNGEARLSDYLVIIKQDVDVDVARPLGTYALTSHGALDRE